MANCKVCPAAQQCKKVGCEKLMAQLGQCQNCKAMVFIGKWEHNTMNVGHKITIECVEDNWKRGDMDEDVMPRGRCGICGSAPLKVKRWNKKMEGEAFENRKH